MGTVGTSVWETLGNPKPILSKPSDAESDSFDRISGKIEAAHLRGSLGTPQTMSHTAASAASVASALDTTATPVEDRLEVALKHIVELRKEVSALNATAALDKQQRPPPVRLVCNIETTFASSDFFKRFLEPIVEDDDTCPLCFRVCETEDMECSLCQECFFVEMTRWVQIRDEKPLTDLAAEAGYVFE